MILRNTEKKFSQLEYKGDKYNVFHAERIDDRVLKENFEYRKDVNNAWTQDRENLLIARVPLITYLQWMKKYPELKDSDPAYRDRFLHKLLRQSENEVFKTVEHI